VLTVYKQLALQALYLQFNEAHELFQQATKDSLHVLILFKVINPVAQNILPTIRLGSHQVNCSGYLLDLKQEIAL
jgi:hypothetical protein